MSSHPEREESPENPTESHRITPSGKSLTDEELLAKMKAHFQERKAVYDALADNLADSYAEAATDPEYIKEQSEWVGSDRVIADSGVESLHTSGSVDKTTSYPQLGADHE